MQKPLDARQRREIIFCQFIETLQDVPVAPSYLLVTITLWRLPSMLKAIKEVISLETT